MRKLFKKSKEIKELSSKEFSFFEVESDLPKEFSLLNKSYKTGNRLIFGYNLWIIHEGHDFSIKDNILKIRIELLGDTKSIFQFIKEVSNTCQNGHEIEDFFNFCPICGIEVL